MYQNDNICPFEFNKKINFTNGFILITVCVNLFKFSRYSSWNCNFSIISKEIIWNDESTKNNIFVLVCIHVEYLLTRIFIH